MSGETASSGWMVKLELAYRELDMSFRAFLITRVLPIFFLGLFTIIVIWWLFPEVISGWLFLILMFVPVYLAVLVLFWPLVEWERKGLAIDRDMHLFITRIGTLSTGESSRQSILHLLSQMEGYRELADEVRKIYKLAEEWHVGLSASCRFIAKQTPSDLFSDFLYRLDHAMALNSEDPQLEGLQAIGERILLFDGQDPTTEVLVRWLYDQISERIQADGTVRSPTGATYEIPEGFRLECVRVWETSTSWAEYVGIE